MSLPFTPRRVTFALCALLLWACSSSDPAATPDDPKPSTGGSEAGGSGSVDVPSEGGSPEEEPGKGSGGSGQKPDDKPPMGGKGGTESEPDPEPGQGGESGDAEPPPPTEGFLRGEEFVHKNECAMCHTDNFAGFTVFPNITPDEETGIGSWTDEEIIAAIRDGVKPDGSKMCETMMRYPLDDEQAADVVEYLRGIPAVSNRITSKCF